MPKTESVYDSPRPSRPTPGMIAFTIAVLFLHIYLVNFPLLRAVAAFLLLFCILAESYYWGIWQSRNEPLVADPPRNTVLALPLLPIIGSIALCTYNTYQSITGTRAAIITGLAVTTAVLGHLYGRWLGTRLPPVEFPSHSSSSVEHRPIVDDGG